MPPYQEKFAIGTTVQVADRASLEEFKRRWKYHHPLEPFQIDCAGSVAKVKDVGFYHGGDVLYTLEGVPGTWHEECLSST